MHGSQRNLNRGRYDINKVYSIIFSPRLHSAFQGMALNINHASIFFSAAAALITGSFRIATFPENVLNTNHASTFSLPLPQKLWSFRISAFPGMVLNNNVSIFF